MKRKELSIVVLILVGIVLMFPTVQGADSKPLVVASIGPLASIVEEAFGDSVEVVTLIPPGVDPHEYQLTAQQVELIKRADVIVTTGGHLPVEKKMQELVGEGVIHGKLLLLEDYQRYGFRYFPERWYNGKDNPHGTWLDPTNAIAIAEATEHALEEANPAHSAEYRGGFDSFKERVHATVDAYMELVEKNATAIINMPPVQYAVEWLGIQAIASIKPEEEVPAVGVDELVDRAKNTDVIVYSPQSPQQLKDASLELAKKAGKNVAGVTVFWQGKPYTEVLRENTANVLKALMGSEELPEKNQNGENSPLSSVPVLFAGISLGAAIGYLLKK